MYNTNKSRRTTIILLIEGTTLISQNKYFANIKANVYQKIKKRVFIKYTHAQTSTQNNSEGNDMLISGNSIHEAYIMIQTEFRLESNEIWPLKRQKQIKNCDSNQFEATERPASCVV